MEKYYRNKIIIIIIIIIKNCYPRANLPSVKLYRVSDWLAG